MRETLKEHFKDLYNEDTEERIPINICGFFRVLKGVISLGENH